MGEIYNTYLTQLTRPLGPDIKPHHMEILEQEFFRNLERNDWEYGGIGVDCKRPFGNSDVEADILKMIGQVPAGDDGHDLCWSSKQREYAAAMYDNLIPWLKNKYLRKHDGTV